MTSVGKSAAGRAVAAISCISALIALFAIQPASAQNDLGSIANSKGILIGYSGNWGVLGHSDVQDIVSTEGNTFTCADLNTSVMTAAYQYDYTLPDRNVNNAAPLASNLSGYLVPGWNNVQDGTSIYWPQWWMNQASTADYIGEMKDYIHNIMSRYKSRVKIWQVVNEPIYPHWADYFTGSSDPFLSHGFFGAGSGAADDKLAYAGWDSTLNVPKYIEQALQQANTDRAGDSSIVLSINDNDNAAYGESKTEAFYNMIASLKQNGYPIDAVGMQLHLQIKNGALADFYGDFFDLTGFAANMQRYADLGVNIYITEFDVQVPTSPSQNDLNQQISAFWNVANVCVSQPRCKSVILWDTTDQSSWLSANTPTLYTNPTGAATATRKQTYWYFRDGVINSSRSSAPIGTTMGLSSAVAGSYYATVDYSDSNNWMRVKQATTVGDWEKMAVEDAGGGMIALKLNDGHYLSCDTSNSARLRDLGATAVNSWEKFTWINLGNGNAALKANANDKYVQCNLNDGDILEANAVKIDTWETFHDPPAAPLMPASVKATAGASGTKKIALTWNACAGATGYIVYRATSSAGPFSQIARSSIAGYTNNGLTAGITYYYKAAASNSSGISSQSAAVSAKTQ